jgi:CheY-like chemotaxis protein
MSKLILIVDDDADDRDLLIEGIQLIDVTTKCITAINGAEALQLLSKIDSKPDLIFLDLNMPRLNGKQFLAEIKSINALQEIPVVIYTTSKLSDDIEETKKLGAAYFITKPVKVSDLHREIKLAFQRIVKIAAGE